MNKDPLSEEMIKDLTNFNKKTPIFHIKTFEIFFF